jgi:iron(III) transport system permease protein
MRGRVADISTSPERLRTPLREKVLIAATLLLALIIALPILSVLFSLLQTGEGVFAHLAETRLPLYISNTLQLALIVGVGAGVVGIGAAWLVTMCRFPGRGWLEWALALPLAFPAYVLAYAYTNLLDHAGPVQSGLRAAFEWGPRDYWFPEIRSLGGAGVMLALVLYPYVYLLARAAFLQQSVAAFDVARTLGYGPWRAFLRIAVPMARPAIATGIALVLMETLADFGTVSHFGVSTFATGVYRSWLLMGDRIAAAQLSACLLMFVLVLLVLERTQRRAAQYHQTGKKYQVLPEFQLTGWRAGAATAFCAAPAFFGFLLPIAVLGRMTWIGGHSLFGERYLGFALNSFILAGVGAVLTVVIAVLLAYAARLVKRREVRLANMVASLGYAVPGSVIAVGLLLPLGAFDNWLDSAMEASFGISTGLLLTGSIGALIFAYIVRFMSVALQTVEAGLGKVTPAMDQAARTLGQGASGAFVRVHAPLIRGGLLTAMLIVFVDIMKELPATLIMRPFNFDTLAVQAYRLAADERLLQASTPSLAIVGVGLVPVILLSWQIRRSRPGSSEN